MHAVADQSIDNLQIVCVYGHIQLQTIVTKVEDGYKLKYDVYQVTYIVFISFRNVGFFQIECRNVTVRLFINMDK